MTYRSKHISETDIPEWVMKEAKKKGRRFVRPVTTPQGIKWQSLSKRGWKDIKQPRKKDKSVL